MDQLIRLQQSLYELMNTYQCKGRIYLSGEGINSQMMLPIHHIIPWENELRQWNNQSLLNIQIIYVVIDLMT